MFTLKFHNGGTLMPCYVEGRSSLAQRNRVVLDMRLGLLLRSVHHELKLCRWVELEQLADLLAVPFL